MIEMVSERRALLLSSASGTPASNPRKLRMPYTVAKKTPPQASGDEAGNSDTTGWFGPACTIQTTARNSRITISSVPSTTVVREDWRMPMYDVNVSAAINTIETTHH